MKPQMGDIWEWKIPEWDNRIGDYATVTYVVLVASKPKKNNQHWVFQGLELDGTNRGVIHEWNMWIDPYNSWRKVA